MNFDMASLLIGLFAGVVIMLVVYARSRGAEYTAEIESLRQQLTTTEASLAESTEASTAAQKEVKALNRELKKAQKGLDKAEKTGAALVEAESRIGELEGQLAGCEAKVAELEAASEAAVVVDVEPGPQSTVDAEPESQEPQPTTLSASAMASDPAEEAPELTIPREPKPKDLQLVEGIGPKISELLIAADIYDLTDLAEAAVDKLKEILVAAGSRYKLADPTSWPEQAALGARGDMDGMKKLQDELKGGRRVA